MGAIWGGSIRRPKPEGRRKAEIRNPKWCSQGRGGDSAAGGCVLRSGAWCARVMDKNTGVTFADVAGCDEAKQDLKEVVDFLKKPREYETLGARVPKGALLVGPPGTGRPCRPALWPGKRAGRSSPGGGADFVEMFVGVGAARVRNLFQQAKQQAPCIIFIDELDAIGASAGISRCYWNCSLWSSTGRTPVWR